MAAGRRADDPLELIAQGGRARLAALGDGVHRCHEAGVKDSSGDLEGFPARSGSVRAGWRVLGVAFGRRLTPRVTANRTVIVSETTFTIGADASCSDGACGAVSRVVVDPVARVVTHLVVEPKHLRGLGRLVPVDLVDVTTDATTGEVLLRCTLAEFEKLDPAEATEFLPVGGGHEGYDERDVLWWPYYGLGILGGAGLGSGHTMGDGVLEPQPVSYDTVPLGEVDVRRGEHVHATDGNIGRVQGLVIDPRNHHVTHVLLQEGHLWGRKKVAIPIGAVVAVDDGIRLNISKHDVQDLPPVPLDSDGAGSSGDAETGD